MSNTKSEKGTELLWQGRIHLGDEAGFYGDAQYTGICVEFPVELFPYSERYQAEGEVTLILEAERVHKADSAYHATVVAYLEDPSMHNQWTERELLTAQLSDDLDGKVEFRLERDIPRYISVRARVDTKSQPGLYDEIMIRRLSIVSDSHYAYVGFRYSAKRQDK